MHIFLCAYFRSCSILSRHIRSRGLMHVEFIDDNFLTPLFLSCTTEFPLDFWKKNSHRIGDALVLHFSKKFKHHTGVLMRHFYCYTLEVVGNAEKLICLSGKRLKITLFCRAILYAKRRVGSNEMK